MAYSAPEAVFAFRANGGVRAATSKEKLPLESGVVATWRRGAAESFRDTEVTGESDEATPARVAGGGEPALLPEPPQPRTTTLTASDIARDHDVFLICTLLLGMTGNVP
jgi:hypothetical protein